MTRLAVVALLVAPAVAPAQGFSRPLRSTPPVNQGSISRLGGGVFAPLPGGFGAPVGVPFAGGFGGVGFVTPGGFYDPGQFATFGPYTYYVPPYLAYAPGTVPVVNGPAAPPLVGAGVPARPTSVPAPATAARSAGGQVAELRLELPAAADVWVNSRQQPGRDAVRTFTSPALPAGGSHVFAVKAVWTAADGTRYEWDRAVTVAAGSRSKVAVAAGVPRN